MSPARQPSGSSRRRRIARQTPIDATLQTVCNSEDSLAGQTLRMCSAAAMTDCAVLRIDKKVMMEALHGEHELSNLFVAYLLSRDIRYEEDLVDQLFNSSEKRLAQILLLLAHFGKEGKPESVVPKIRQEVLAEMIGTTRSRVSFFMNRFRKLGFIHYSGGLQVPQLAAQRRSARLAVLSCTERWYRRGFRRKGKWSIHSRV